MSAVCRRYNKEFAAALEALATLQSVTPENGRAYQEQGHVFRDMGQPDNALRAYAQACRFNPALEASWRGQHEILSAKGLQRPALQVLGQIERLQALPPALMQSWT